MFTLFFCIVAIQSFGQDTTTRWNLRKAVDYAMRNNISVKQADIQARIAALQMQQAKLNQYPNASGSAGLGIRLGRSIDPTTNSYVSAQFLYQNFGINGGVQVYNWGKLKNTVSAYQFSAQAALADVEKSASDAALNVCTYYLQILSAKEQVNISEVQVKQTQSQLGDTRKRVDAGALPELNALELESQLATDSTNLMMAKATLDQDILTLKGVLNIDAAAIFDVETPAVETIPLQSFGELQPDIVFQLALNNQPLQKGNKFRTLAAQKNIQVAKAGFYPTIQFGYNLTTNFSSSFKQVDGYSFSGYTTGAYGVSSLVNVGGTNYFVQSPNYNVQQSGKSFGHLWDGYGDQLNNNFGQSFGFSLSIPIFNNGQSRIAYEQSKLNLKAQQLNNEQADVTLKLNIYTAYSNAVSALQQFNSGKKNVESAQKVYDFSVKRYEIGLLGTIDLITNQNNLLKAKLQQVANQYNYVFRMKLLEFYKGQGLKL